MTKLSVIIPIYNTPRELLEHCLSSVQDNIRALEEVEVLCVNDGSTEPYVEEILKETESQDKRFRYIPKLNNTGLSDTRNVGMGMAQGEYIVFIDADDYLEPDALQYMLDKIEETESEVVMFGYTEDDNYDKHQFRKLYTNADRKELSIVLMSGDKKWRQRGFALCTAWAKIFKRDFILRNNLSYIKGVLAEDEIFALNFVNVIDKFYVDNKLVYHFVKNDLSLTHTWNSQIVNRMVYDFQILNEFVTNNYPKDKLIAKAMVLKTYSCIRTLKNRNFTHPQNAKSFWELKSEMNDFLNNPVIKKWKKNLRLYDAEDLIDFKNRLLLKLHLYWYFLITERRKRKIFNC